jgi:hypothetical protein
MFGFMRGSIGAHRGVPGGRLTLGAVRRASRAGADCHLVRTGP